MIYKIFARCALIATLVGSTAGCALAQEAASPARLTIDTAQIVSPVSPTLYGMMTEEINHSYDGGLYAEMIRNRTMRANWSGLESWALVRRGNASAQMTADKTNGPSAALPTSMRLTISAASARNEAGVANAGYWGMAIRPHTTYHGSFYAKTAGDVGSLHAQLIADDTGAILAEAHITLRSGDWSQYEFTLTSGELVASAANHLELTLTQPGTIWLQLVSLFPPTYENRPNGNRVDLMQRMAAMHPHFLRLPGGNYLEGDTIAERFQWKKTIGPLVDRPGHQAPWSYWSTDGMGLLEFLEWCEDLKIEPVLAVYAGYSLKGEHVAPGTDLEPYVQDALDEVEYVTGETSTKWGAERARDGHPAPFPLHYIEIGNEDWFDKSDTYPARFAQIALALRKRYPQYKLIATAPIKVTDPGAEPDVIDDHYYKSPAEMFDLVHHYDDAPRSGPKVFVGEWATRSGSPTPNFGDALGDAAWMTSLERNSDLIVMASYAPLFVNVNPGAMQWATDLIGYDALSSYGSPSYYAQCLFAAHLGDGTAKSSIEGSGARFFYSATVSSVTKILHLKLVNASDKPQPLMLKIDGLAAGARTAEVNSLHGASYEATNNIANPEFIHPVKSLLRISGSETQHTVAPLTIEVVDIPLYADNPLP
jgi:alpha-N-arabinofuranosidase